MYVLFWKVTALHSEKKKKAKAVPVFIVSSSQLDAETYYHCIFEGSNASVRY